MVSCSECGDDYEMLASHWNHSPSHRPKITQRQEEIITGLMMSDAYYIQYQGRTPTIGCAMKTKEYLEWLDDVFATLSNGVKHKATAEEMAQMNRESGFRPDAKAENYSDKWEWRSRAHPDFSEWDWYSGSDGEKVWPDDIELTPTVLTHLYIGDGNYWYDKAIRIAASNEAGNEDKIDRYFECQNLPTPSNYAYSERKDGSTRFSIQFDQDGTKELFEYMDSAPPGFEYKFP